MTEVHYLPDRRPDDRGHIITGTKPAQCDKHGAFQSIQWTLNNPPEGFWDTSRWSACPVCDAEMQAEVDAKNAEIKGGVTEKDRARAAMVRAAGIPERYKDCNIWGWVHGMDQQKRVWQVVRDYCHNIADVLQVGRCLVFIGAPGTGKTHLACGIVRHVVEHGGTARYYTVADMVGTIRMAFAKDSATTEQESIEAMASYDVLVLDEVGRQTDSPHERETLFRVLDRRYANLRPVVLISNLSPQAFQDFMGQSIIDRLREAGGRFMRFDWLSHRSRKRPDFDTDKEQDR